MNELTILQTQLTQVLNGTLRPSCIVGTGYKSSRGVASAWLRKEIHNKQNPNCRVDDVYVQVNGKPFATEAKAMQSKAYQQLVKGEFCCTPLYTNDGRLFSRAYSVGKRVQMTSSFLCETSVLWTFIYES